jgi:Tfp pilus assembly protein PilN
MIQINLLPGAKRKKAWSLGAGSSLGALASGAVAKIRDPYLLAAVVGSTVAILAVGGMAWYQRNDERLLTDRQEQATQDSTRYATVVSQRLKAEAQRDSVLKQLKLITTIDNNRFVWPHVMDELSRALPPYTWLTALEQTSVATSPAATDTMAPPPPPSHAAKRKAAAVDTTIVPETVKFRVTGRTVDIQALTRYMKLLEASPFIRNVNLAKSDLVLVDGKDVTEFQLDCEYETPNPAVLRTVPVALTVGD